jgi:hypothetical protein
MVFFIVMDVTGIPASILGRRKQCKDFPIISSEKN